MFHTTEKFPALHTFETGFSQIKYELDRILGKPLRPLHESTWAGERPDYLTNPTDRSTAWKTYTFRFFGIDHLPNMESCPFIASLVRKFPAIVTAEFSMLEPHTHILPHKGYTHKVLRSHLGMQIPVGDTAIRVGNETRSWEEGKFLIFDDSIDHEAWNRTDEQRIVLMLDFEPGFDEDTAKRISHSVITSTKDKYLLEIAPREMWVEWLEKGQFPRQL